MPTSTLRVEELAFRKGITKYIRATCRQYGVSRVNVEDLVQETLTEIVASIASFRPEKGDFDKWGRGVALNVILRYLRDAQRYAERFSAYHPSVEARAAHAPSPEWCAQRMQAICQLSSAAAALTEQQAQILMLHVVDGLSHGDIGSELGISEAASQKCYQRARNHMAQCIAEEMLSVPLVMANCNDASVPEPIDLPKWSHYSGQIAAAIVAFLMFLPVNQPEQVYTSAGKMRIGHGRIMYWSDKQALTFDKPVVCPDVPKGKPEPATLPSVRVVPARTSIADKPSTIEQFARLPPYKHTVRPAEHTLLGR